MNSLYWLCSHVDIRQAIRNAATQPRTPYEQVAYLRWLAGHQLDFNQEARLDRRLQVICSEHPEAVSGLSRIKLAILASSTVEHLQSSIRVAALRRGLLVEIYVAPYGQYQQEVLNSTSQLYQFKPDAVLLALDGRELRVRLPLEATWSELEVTASQCVEKWENLWQILKARLGTEVIQQTFTSPLERLFGNYDVVTPATPISCFHQINYLLQRAASEQRILLLDIESLAANIGNPTWNNPTLWHHSKQAISPVQAPLYGEQVARILAALRGLSSKCLVLDLDNTLWGGVIGDDGLGGIELGQGTGPGEAFQAFQHYVKSLKQRGIILAVCSKNDQENALEPFEKHPEMVLRKEDFAVFVANWEDKATNLKRIAARLNIGLDSLVFFDDNPAERAIIRQFTPNVAVPEVPEDPAQYIRCLSDAGYFEAVSFSEGDTQRAEQYRSNVQREELKGQSHRIEDFLENLKMELTLASVDSISLQRAAQLINRSNQFNLTTRRYTETQIRQMLREQDVLCWQARLRDVFGDNGLISVVIAKPTLVDDRRGLHIDTWLMSCRVLGRQVEQAVLNVLVDEASQRDYCFLLGEYIKTKKNEMVREHYQRLGFEKIYEKQELDNIYHSFWQLDLERFRPSATFINVSFSR